jgi:hypothetical protein
MGRVGRSEAVAAPIKGQLSDGWTVIDAEPAGQAAWI